MPLLYPILSQSDGDSSKTEVRHKADLRDANGIVVLLLVVGLLQVLLGEGAQSRGR